MTPGAVQSPRPPLTVGGQSPTVLRVAAERADCWNTHGPFGRGVDEIVSVTAAQNRRLDELCVSHGRRPADLRRSLLLFDALDVWAAPRDLAGTVERFLDAGTDDFVLFWPPPRREGELADVADVLARYRDRGRDDED
jgi:alkanesulfonate monooxygenase SsuD/methylene tetrahydromethanopterin reductase-like flavin-dependent oxidoreductase (luciferase family)